MLLDFPTVIIPDYGTGTYRHQFEVYQKTLGESIHNSPREKLREFLVKEGEAPSISKDSLNLVPSAGNGNGKKIHLSLLYEINDELRYVSSIVKIGFHKYFVMERSVYKEGHAYDGIFRLNDEKWYELQTGMHFDMIADIGKNRVVAFKMNWPRTLYGFRWNFEDMFTTPLRRHNRLRKGLHKLSDRRFLFHNYRENEYDYAVEIYDSLGRLVKEVHDEMPYLFKGPRRFLPLAAQTAVASDGKGFFYVASQYPLNPYRIWKYDENGNKMKVFGNYLAHPDVYFNLEDWILWDYETIKRYGIPRVYAVNKLLTDSEGRVYVFFSINRHGKLEKKEPRYYLDIFTGEGEFLGRKEFVYGFPELIDEGIIYSRRPLPPDGNAHWGSVGKWTITAVQLDIGD
ncbi:MAG: hypothetical protein GY765_15275 [bacterium]|nr:hypothetical protein [bacterium]